MLWWPQISDWWDKKVEELSKGMAQKVQFIVTVLHKPELLIYVVGLKNMVHCDSFR